MSNVAQALATMPLFSALPPEELQDAAAFWHIQELASGEAFCLEGEPGDSLAVLVQGECAVRVGQTHLSAIAPGQLIGEVSAFFAGGARSATVEARGPATILALPRPGLLALRRRRSAMYMAILNRALRQLAHRVNWTNERVGRMVEGDAPLPTRKEPSALLRLWKTLLPGKPTRPAPPLEPLIRRLPGLGYGEPQVVARLQQAFELRSFEEGEILITEGHLGDSAWILADGEVDVVREVHGNRTHRLIRMGPGDLFGINALLLRGPRTASCVAATAGWAYRLPANMHDSLEGEVALWWKECILRVMETQLRFATTELWRHLNPPGTGDGEVTAEQDAHLHQAGVLEGLPTDALAEMDVRIGDTPGE